MFATIRKVKVYFFIAFTSPKRDTVIVSVNGGFIVKCQPFVNREVPYEIYDRS